MEIRLFKFFAAFLGVICIFGVGFAARENIRAFGNRFYAATKETLVHSINGERANNKERIYLNEGDSHSSSDSPAEKIVSVVSFPSQEADNLSESSAVRDEQHAVIQQCSFKSVQFPLQQGVILNEIAWMGGESSANDEWIELKNIGSSDFDIAGWQLVDKEGQIKAVFGGDAKIKAQGFYLLERTDDSAVSSVAADGIYQGALSDTNEALRLFDKQCNLIDEVFADVGSGMLWPVGEKKSKKTMERNSDNPGWHTSEKSGGTPRAENSVPMPSPVQSVEGAPTSTAPSGPADDAPPAESPPAPPPVEVRVLINEVQIAGETADDEFVELYNPTAQPIDMTGWSLKKKSSGGSESTVVTASRFENKIIPAHGYLLLVHTESYRGTSAPDVEWPKSYPIAANNTLLLYRGDGAVADKIGFGSAVDFEGSAFPENPAAGKSIARTNGEDMDNNAADFTLGDPTPLNSH